MANEVNLVEQQTNKIRKNLREIQKILKEENNNYKCIEKVSIETMHGEMGIDHWNNIKWV